MRGIVQVVMCMVLIGANTAPTRVTVRIRALQDHTLTVDVIGGGSTLREVDASSMIAGDSVRLKTPGSVVFDVDRGEALFRVVGDSARLHVDVLSSGGTRMYAEAQALTVGLRYGKLVVRGVPVNYRPIVHGQQ